MFALILIIILVGFYAYYAYDECNDLVPTIFVCFLIVLAVSLLFFTLPCLFASEYEYTVSYDSYSITDDGLRGITVHYFVDDGYFKIHVDGANVFTGEERGFFIICEKRFIAPEWFWLIAFIPDNMLIRTDVLIV